MNATERKLERVSFGEYLEFRAPTPERYSPGFRVWESIKQDSLESAAIWRCDFETASSISFGYEEPGTGPGSIYAQGYMEGDPWEGIQKAHYVDGDYVSAGLCQGWIASELGVVYLNHAIATWAHRPYAPVTGSSEAFVYGSLLVADAGWGGDITLMSKALETYGVSPDLSYGDAFYFAAKRGQVPFLRALRRKLGDKVGIFTFEVCKSFETASSADRGAVANALGVGIPFPSWCRPALVHWSKTDPRFTSHLL